MVVRLVRVIYTQTGIEDNTGTSGIDVYPNPTSGKFSVTMYLPNTEQARVSIMNLLGEEITVVHNGKLTSAQYEVDLSNQPAGVYYVKVQSDNTSLLKKIVLSK
jgi:hypothetical protein